MMMRISVVRSSGVSEPRRSATVDAVQLSAQLRPALGALADLAKAKRRVRQGPVLRSQPHYAITLHDAPEAAGPLLLTLYESQVPSALRPLLDEIMRHAH
jgi:hypothetical protein